MEKPIYNQIGMGYDNTRKADPEITRNPLLNASAPGRVRVDYLSESPTCFLLHRI
ncbi:hypothetical protein XYCOK13_32290 [Xylanibacillus composti]|uniref:Uncharacterized protein n=1 Tax=Xylanibacillus composti TaxID=1572762 RepID=A0A8J4H671_9BACL|nr:hypothetical protein XYCOK13_32290 [Xylanibacillus composti]